MSSNALSLVEGVLEIAQKHLNGTGYTNPWKYVRAELAEQITPVAKGHFLDAIYVASALMAVTTLLLAASLVVRWRSGALWLFRVHDADGLYIIPHTTNAWTSLAILMLGILQGYLWEEAFANKGIIELDLCQWQILPWMAPMIGFWVAAWSLTTSHILYVKSGTERRGSDFPFYMSAPFVNFIGIAVPLLHIASVVPLAEVASHYYRKGMGRYQDLQNILYQEQLAYNGTFDTTFVAKHIDYAVVYYSDYQLYYKWFAYSFYLLLGWGLAVQVFLMVIGATHSWALHSAVRSMRSRRAPGTHVIEETYRSLLWMCIAFIGSTTVLNANFVFVAHYGKKVNTKPLQAQIATLLAPYIVSAICLPLSILLLHRAFVSTAHIAATSGESGSNSRAKSKLSKLPFGWRGTGKNSTIAPGWTTVEGFETLAMKTIAQVEEEAGGRRPDSPHHGKFGADRLDPRSVVTVHFTEDVVVTTTKELERW